MLQNIWKNPISSKFGLEYLSPCCVLVACEQLNTHANTCSSTSSGKEDIKDSNILYLLKFLHHFLDAQLPAVAHLVLHLSQPSTELFVLVAEDGPGIETVRNLSSARRYLQEE